MDNWPTAEMIAQYEHEQELRNRGCLPVYIYWDEMSLITELRERKVPISEIREYIRSQYKSMQE